MVVFISNTSYCCRPCLCSSFVELATEFVDEAAEEDDDIISQASEGSSSTSPSGSYSSNREQDGRYVSNGTRRSVDGSDVASESMAINESSCIRQRGKVGGGRWESEENRDGYVAGFSISQPREVPDLIGVNERRVHDSDDGVVDVLTLGRPMWSSGNEGYEFAGYRGKAPSCDKLLCMRAQAKS